MQHGQVVLAGDGQRQVLEGLFAGRVAVTGETLHGGQELAVEHVANDRTMGFGGLIWGRTSSIATATVVGRRSSACRGLTLWH